MSGRFLFLSNPLSDLLRYESIKAANEAEAEKFEEQLRNIQKKMQSMEGQFDACTEDLFNQTIKVNKDGR